MNSSFIKTVLFSIAAGVLITLINFLLPLFTSPTVLGLSMYFLNYSLGINSNFRRSIRLAFVNYFIIAVICFVSALLLSLSVCRLITFLSQICILENIFLLITKEALVFFIPWAFVFAFWIRKLIKQYIDNKRV